MMVTYFAVLFLVQINQMQSLNLVRGNFEQRSTPPTTKSTLLLTHVIFRHGNRTKELSESYPKDPYLNYDYFPFGHGQLTNAGKSKEYFLGKALRERYDTFLGKYYYPEIVDSQSTNYNRTKMSLLLVLASLFPPKGEEIWSNVLNWQPIPYNYLSQNRDKVLLGTLCPNYVKSYKETVSSPKFQAEYKKYEKDFKYISANTGLNITTFEDVYNLNFGLTTEKEWGFKLPPWTDKVWPEIMNNLAVKYYFDASANTNLLKISSGYFFKKMIDDSRKKIIEGPKKNNIKMYLYSAHELNLALILILLDVFKPPHIPNYGSYIIFEVHNINQTYGIKIYYENYTKNKIELLKLPACSDFCPLDKFSNIIHEYLPTDESCGN